MSMSMSTFRVQSDSMLVNPMLVVLGKGDGGGVTIGVERHGEGKDRRRVRGSQSSKQM